MPQTLSRLIAALCDEFGEASVMAALSLVVQPGPSKMGELSDLAIETLLKALIVKYGYYLVAAYVHQACQCRPVVPEPYFWERSHADDQCP